MRGNLALKCYLALKDMKYHAANKAGFTVGAILFLAMTWAATAAVNISGPRAACEGQSVDLSAPPGFRSYRWLTGETTQSITVRQSGRYSVVVTDALGVIDSGEVNVTFFPRPRPRIGNPQEFICEGQSATLSAIAGYQSYRWNTGETSRQILVSTAGWYHLEVVDSNGCVGSSDSIFLSIVPNPQPTIVGPTQICNSGIRSYSVNAPPGALISWTIGGLGTVVGPSNTANLDVDWVGSGHVDVRVSVPRPDGGFCESTRRVLVRMGSILRPELDFARRNFCQGEQTVLRVAGSFARYRWNDGSTADSLVVSQQGRYWAEVEDNAGCTGVSDSVIIIVYPLPVITVAGANFLCEREQTILTATAGGNDVVLWEWSTGERSASILVTAPGSFTVTGTTINGCRASVTHVVRPGRYPRTSEFTLSHDLGVIDLGSTVDALLDTIAPGVTLLGIRLVATDSPDGTRGQPRIVDGGAIPGTEIWFRMLPRAEGRHRAVIRIVMRDECTDSVDIEVTFNVVRRLVTTAITIAIADTIVDTGTELSLPIQILVQPGISNELVDVDLILRWDVRVFKGHRMNGATTLALDVVGTQQYAVVRLPQINMQDSLAATLFIEGLALLASQVATPVVLDSFNIIGTEQYDVTPKHGSISTRSCWVTGRLVRFGVLYAFTASAVLRGQLLEVNARSMPSDLIDIFLFGADGRNLLAYRCSMQTDDQGLGQCAIDVRGLPAGLYLVQAKGRDGQLMLPVLVAP